MDTAKLDILTVQLMQGNTDDRRLQSFVAERAGMYVQPLHPEATAILASNTEHGSTQDPSLQLQDEWISQLANLNTPNSILASMRFVPFRMSYTELTQLSKEPYINKIITLKTRDIIGNKGTFTIKGQVQDASAVIDRLETRLNKLDFWNVIQRACITAFIYGGALIYVNCTDAPADALLPMNYEGYRGKIITSLEPVSPVYCQGIPQIGRLAFYSEAMKPSRWYINGEAYDASQIVTLVWQDVEPSEKPLYNFLGQPFIEKLAPAVRQYELINKMGIELFSKMRLILFKSQGIVNKSNRELIQQLDDLRTMVNNQSVVMISAEDDLVNLTTAPTGLDDLLHKYAQNMCAVAGIPATKLLGYSPQGLNNTGEGDLKSYYDEIEGHQKTYLHRIVVNLAQRVLWSLGVDAELDFEFTPLAQESNVEKTARHQAYVTMLDTLINNGTVDNELAFTLLQEQGIIPQHAQFPYKDDPQEAEALAAGYRQSQESSNGN